MQEVISTINGVVIAVFWLVVVSFAVGAVIMGIRGSLTWGRDLIKKISSKDGE